jgi:hypothetical protein
MAIKSKNRAKIFLGGGHMTKIRTKFYIFLFFLLLFFFFLILGGTMAHPGPPLPPSLNLRSLKTHIIPLKRNRQKHKK